jgi:hypothetical protein
VAESIAAALAIALAGMALLRLISGSEKGWRPRHLSAMRTTKLPAQLADCVVPLGQALVERRPDLARYRAKLGEPALHLADANANIVSQRRVPAGAIEDGGDAIQEFCAHRRP